MPSAEAIRVLNGLIRACRDNEVLCRTCSALVGRNTLRAMLHHRSRDWAREAEELQALVLLLNGEPVVTASAYTRALLAWLGSKAALLGTRELAILEVLEAAQQRANDRCAEALTADLPERIRRALDAQSERMEERTERLRMLRGQYALHSERAERV